MRVINTTIDKIDTTPLFQLYKGGGTSSFQEKIKQLFVEIDECNELKNKNYGDSDLEKIGFYWNRRTYNKKWLQDYEEMISM